MRLLIFTFFFFFSLVSFGQFTEDSSLLIEADEGYIPYKLNNSWTLLGLDSGEVRTDLSFDEWIPQGDFSDFYTFRKEDRYGAIGYFGDTLLPFEYDTVITSNNGLLAQKGNEWTISLSAAAEQVENDWDMVDVADPEITFISLELDSLHERNDLIYLHQKGKVGLYFAGKIILPPVYEAVQPLNKMDLYNKTHYAVLAFDGVEFQFFDFQGNDLLGTPTPEFELMRNNFVRYRINGRWLYYNFLSQKTYDSQGNDAVIYEPQYVDFEFKERIKIYGPDRSNATFHAKDQSLSGFDDYFPLGHDYVAYRQGGKIGLMDLNGTVHFPARYDKIELISRDLGYFKFFRGDSCGLVNKAGVELFQPTFANIVATQDPDRLIVIDNDFTGVVNKQGKVIIPLVYDYISHGKECFLIEKSDLIGLVSNDGEIIFKPQFIAYWIDRDNWKKEDYYLIIFKDFTNQLILANNRGKLTNEKFNDFNSGNQTIKLYRKGEIEVLVLSDNTELVEAVKYPNVNSLEVNSGKWDRNINLNLGGWDVSYLEEDQLTGKFGLRYFAKKGVAVEPIYYEVQPTRLSSFMGERLDEGSFQLTEDITLRRRAVYDQMYTGNGQVENADLVTIESAMQRGGSLGSASSLTQTKNNHGAVEMVHSSMPFTFAEADTVNVPFSRRFETGFNSDSPHLYFIDAKPVVCDRISAEISLFEFYHYYNMLGGLRLTKETAPKIMNPDLGIRFEGGIKRVSDLDLFLDNKERVRFDPWEDYHDFRFSELGDFVFSKELEDTALWTLRDFRWEEDGEALPTKKCIDYRELSHWFDTRLELKELGITKLIIHEDFPNFEYILSDSLKRNYYAGRLIQEEEKGWKLVDPEGKTYTSEQSKIRYLGEGVFAANSGRSWQVINRNGEVIIERTFLQVGSVNNGFFTASNNDLKGIYSINGEVLVESSQMLDHVEGSLYKVSLTPKEVWYDASTKIYDTLQTDEVYLGNRTFLSKTEGGDYTLRKFGNVRQMKVSTDIKPYCILDAVVYKKKKKLSILDSSGEVTTYKKASKPREYGQFMRIDGKKDRLILNQGGKHIHIAEEDARLRTYRDELWVHTSDTNYLVAQTGETSPLNSEMIKPSVQAITKDLEIVRESGKMGALRNGETILPAKFDRLYYAGNGEFGATQNFTINLFDSDLEQINAIPYHQCFFIDEDVLMLELNGTWYFYKKESSWTRIK